MKVLVKGRSLMFKKLSLSVLVSGLLCVNSSFAYVQPSLEFSGEVSQGGLIVGKTEPENTVTLNGNTIKVAESGHFAFGYGRDETQPQKLIVTNDKGLETVKWLTPKAREYKIQRIEGIKKSIMNPNPKAVARAKKDSAQVRAARGTDSDLTYFTTGFIAPIDGVVTGVYGSQRVYNGVPKTPHFGIDYAGKKGDPVKAPASGTIILNVPDMFYSGGTMIIDHGHGVTSTFLHLSDSYVEVGDIVKQGDVVAAVGSTGRSTGPHLDWRVNWFQTRLDPALALKVKPQ